MLSGKGRAGYFRRGLSALMRKEFIQVLRDKRMCFIVFGAPIVQLLVFGFAVTFDIQHIPLAVVDYDRSPASRKLASSLSNTVYFDTVGYPESESEALALMDAGRVSAVLVIPAGLYRHLGRGETARVGVWVDGSDANTANVAAKYAEAIIYNYSADIALEQYSVVGPMTTFVPRFQVWYNPELKSTVFMIPGVICLILTVITIILTSTAIVREREMGTLEQVMVTPLSRLQFMLGKLTPYTIICFIAITLVIALSYLIFSVPIRGNIFLLYFCSALFILTSLGVGLLISTVSRTQQQAMLSTMFYAFPAIILSGFMYPIANMPRFFQYITYANPLRYFLEIIRGIMLKGNGIGVLWLQALMLAVIGIVTITLSSLRFQKRVG